MNIIMQINGQTAVLKIEGRLDTLTAPQLEEKINSLAQEIQHLVLDLQGLQYVSSAGLRVILAAQKRMSAVGTMKLTSVSEAVMEVFEITGFADVLTIE